MSEKQPHREEYLYIPALTHEAAIIAWGGFFFDVKEKDGKEEWQLLDSSTVERRLGRKELIGEKAMPYASQARVELNELNGDHSLTLHIAGANHAVVTGLKPDTTYEYGVFVREEDGLEQQWAAGPLRDWVFVNGEGTMRKGGHYENRLRTFPDPNLPTPSFEFAVIGDFGRGVRKPSKDARCQREVADALLEAANHHDIRMILTTGDNIYAKTFLGMPVSSSGDEDDDWFFTYFQPYRYLLNRFPVFPAVGNHDGSDNEESLDRDQIYDNFYIRTQFAQLRETHDSSLAHGLFYRFPFGRDVDFICLDTSKSDSGKCFVDVSENAPFLQRIFTQPAPRWRIAYSHHPAYCAGPRHSSLPSLRQFFKAHGDVRVSFSGHEHNFQYSRDGGQHHFLTGGGGKFRSDALAKENIASELCQAWGGNVEGHFLIVKLDVNKRMEVIPYGHLKDKKLRPIALNPASSVPFFVELPNEASLPARVV